MSYDKFKIITVVGTRPELIKMSLLIKKLDKFFNHKIVHTGQNYDYELNQIFFDELEIRRPDFFLNVASNNLGSTIGSIIEKSYKVFQKEKPDAILVYGDTNSCLSVISAKRLKIPIFHMEAGNRCFDERVPEEINRKIVDHLSDVNMVLSDNAKDYLVKEGINPSKIFKTGSHMGEVLDHYKTKINKSNILKKLKLKKNNFFIVSIHREENLDLKKNLKELVGCLDLISSKFKKKIIFSTHPRTEKKFKSNKILLNKNITFLKPFGFCDYINLQKNSLCVISDSGTIFEETDLLGLSSVTIRNATERPEGFDSGLLIMTGLNKTNVINSINYVISNKVNNNKITDPLVYKDKNTSDKIIKIIFSYIDYINKFTWFKNEK